MNALELFGELRRLGVTLRAEGDELRCRAPQGVLTPELLDRLRRSKPELLACLAEAGGGDVQSPGIPRAPKGVALPLSFGQQRLWLLDRLSPGDPSYNIVIAASVAGRLDVAAMQRALTAILSRHEALRTVFAASDGVPRQVILPPREVPLPLIELAHLSAGGVDDAIREAAEEYARRPFDVATGPLFRAEVIRVEDTRHVLLMSMHHIVADGWSVGVLVREIASIYTAIVEHRPVELPELPIQYADYAVWQRERLSGATLERLKGYWTQKLAGQPTSLPLGRWRALDATPASAGRKHLLALPSALTENLLALSGREGARLFMTLMAGLYILLARYTGERDLSIGFPIANRTQPQLDPLIGFFANTLILRQQLRGNPTFRELLREVRNAALDAFTHQEMPFDYLTQLLRPDRNATRNPLFSVLFALQQRWLSAIEFAGLTLSPMEIDNRTAKFDLNVTLSEQAGGLQGWIQYSDQLFEPSDISRMAGHLRTLLESAVESPDAPIFSLPMVTGEERRDLIALGSSTVDAVAEESVLDLFERQAARTPSRVAVECDETRLTYADLDRLAAALAARLRARGVGPDMPVGIWLERSPDVIVTIVAAWKAGGAYLPLDPALPPDRLALILADAAPRAIVTSAALAALLPSAAREAAVYLDGADGVALDPGACIESPGADSPDRLAYLIYTSGSTGTPKGVAITHRSVASLLAALDRAVYRDLGAAPLAVAVNGPFSFDTSVKQIMQLGRGHTLHLLPDRLRSDPRALLARLRQRPIDVLDCTPSQLRLLADAGLLDDESCASMTLLIGGEPVDDELWRRLGAHTGRPAFNLYGPTECTVDATACRVDVSAPPTIGRPLGNTRAFVLDGGLHPAPVGVAGELYVGGRGVARGYYRRPGLTAETFLPDPFDGEDGARMYRTRDVARWLPSGDLEFVGRTDRLVKLRGHRIELEEIESALRSHPAIAQAAMAVREVRPGDQRLVAYTCAHPSGRPALMDLRTHLRRRLPAWMMPAEFVWLDALPLNAHGKIDYQQLPAIDSLARRREHAAAPRDLVELEIVRVWEDVLRIHPIEVTDNFFALGGHSFLAVLVAGGIKQRLGIDLPLATIFEHPTVEQLAAAVRGGAVSSWSPVVAIRPAGTKPPFFCVHPVGGGVLCYMELADALGSDQPFYAFQCDHGESSGDAASIAEMASRYIEAMRRVQPAGPYRLGGWSIGGLIAFEMSRQLTAAGQQVAVLGILDSRPPTPIAPQIPLDETALLKRFVNDLTARSHSAVELLEAIDAAPATQRMARLLAVAVENGLLPPDVDEGQMRRLMETFRGNLHAAHTYQPRAGHVLATLVLSEANAATRVGEWAHAWSTLATGTMTCHTVPGDHYSIMRRPHVDAVARILCDALEQAAHLERSMTAAPGTAAAMV